MKDRFVEAGLPAVYLSEIFCSVQGEGIYVGVTQIFLRLAGCSFCCGYCDTRDAAVTPKEYMVAGMVGTDEFDGTVGKGDGQTTFPNPVTAPVLSAYLEKYVPSIPGLHSLSVTGGEPLEQPDFLEAFLPLFRRSGIPVYLETNGLHESAAARIAPLVDIVSMDIKLPSLCLPGGEVVDKGGAPDSGTTGKRADASMTGNDIFDIYSRVIPVFARKDLFVKVVIDDGFDPVEFEKAVDQVARTDPSIPFVIQPVTSSQMIGCKPPTNEKLMFARGIAAAVLEDVRVIPQCHKLLGIR
ncbi:MAG: 7-carboxy-7-deazaguanine synthase QueE [Bacteroidales bacterium]|nr:7-carboxy-7-deazaguanine synthase QueE [Candidatus Latescibacterota bacterium]